MGAGPESAAAFKAMARYAGPKKKKMRKFGLLPESPAAVKGKRQRRLSDYGLRLREKQKLKFVYGVLERQFRKYFNKSSRDPQNTGLVLLQKLERRLDNVVYRLGFANSRAQSRQLVRHGHIEVNGQKVDIPSYQLCEGETITLRPQSLKIPLVEESLKASKSDDLPGWLQRKGAVGRLSRLPGREEVDVDIDEQLVIEYYSR